jgi:hypothetical protein
VPIGLKNKTRQLSVFTARMMENGVVCIIGVLIASLGLR